jgi:ADP-heptose:LPS heptosyltransferase
VQLAAAVAATAALPRWSVLAGQTDVLGLTAVVAAAGLVVCGDTGVAHVATAVGTPSVVLFGPTPPDQWGPPATAVSGPAEGRAIHRALWAGHVGDPHGDQPDDGLLAIHVEEVLAAVVEARTAALEAAVA